jgi:hypothetical protein
LDSVGISAGCWFAIILGRETHKQKSVALVFFFTKQKTATATATGDRRPYRMQATDSHRRRRAPAAHYKL